MKLIKTIIGITTLATISVLVPWVIVFFGSISSDPTNWASFGSYVGGTLSPIIALMALIGLLYTIIQQQKQIENLGKLAAKEDLFRVIEKIENDFYKNLKRYPITLTINGEIHPYSAVDVLFDLSFLNYKKVIKNADDLKEHIEKETIQFADPTMLVSDMFATATGHLNQLRTFVKSYDELSNNNALSLYYIGKYKIAFKRLYEKGLIKELWINET